MKPKKPLILDPISLPSPGKNLFTVTGSVADDLLIEIRKGYLEFIEHAEERKRFIARQECVKKFANDNSTEKNIVKRKEELREKILMVIEDNQKLRTILAPKQFQEVVDRGCFDCSEEYNVQKEDSDSCEKNESIFPSLYFMKSWHKESSLNVDVLQDKYDELKDDLIQLRSAVSNKYGEVEKYMMLKNKLFQEEKFHDKVSTYNKRLKDIIEEQKKQIQILKEELSEEYPDERPCTKRDWSEPFLPLLEEKKFESDEPEDQKLVSSCIIYVNRFNDEFKKGNYKLAAQLAANSPRGILRSYATYLQFQNASTDPSSKSCPSYVYCEALIKTSYFGGNVGESLSYEIIKCAVLQCNISLVKHWLFSVILTWSKAIGDLLISTCDCQSKCNCGWTLLGLQVYTKLKLYAGVVLCHLKLNNFKHVTKLMKDHSVSPWEFKDMVSYRPHIQLSYLLSDACIEKPYITLPGMIATFLDHRMYSNVIALLAQVFNEGLHKESLFNCLLKESSYDEMGEGSWEKVLDICLNSGELLLAEELYACLMTRTCLEKASIFCLCDYIS